jgi:hypothetical protein
MYHGLRRESVAQAFSLTGPKGAVDPWPGGGDCRMMTQKFA